MVYAYFLVLHRHWDHFGSCAGLLRHHLLRLQLFLQLWSWHEHDILHAGPLGVPSLAQRALLRIDIDVLQLWSADFCYYLGSFGQPLRFAIR